MNNPESNCTGLCNLLDASEDPVLHTVYKYASFYELILKCDYLVVFKVLQNVLKVHSFVTNVHSSVCIIYPGLKLFLELLVLDSECLVGIKIFAPVSQLLWQ